MLEGTWRICVIVLLWNSSRKMGCCASHIKAQNNDVSETSQNNHFLPLFVSANLACLRPSARSNTLDSRLLLLLLPIFLVCS